MAVKSSGSLSFNTDIVGEFGGSTPHSLSEYYRGGVNVPSGVTDVPASGEIKFSDFYGTSNALDVAYYVVGAGGGGGAAGLISTNGSAGGSTSISGSGFTTVTAAGGGGGGGGRRVSDTSGIKLQRFGGAGVTIGGVERGAGGDGGFNLGGGDDTEYGGAGGGGAGGAGQSSLDPTGNGGAAAEYKTGTLSSIPIGTVITVTIGNGGAGAPRNYAGTSEISGYRELADDGADGFVRLTINGTNYDFTSSGSHTV